MYENTKGNLWTSYDLADRNVRLSMAGNSAIDALNGIESGPVGIEKALGKFGMARTALTFRWARIGKAHDAVTKQKIVPLMAELGELAQDISQRAKYIDTHLEPTTIDPAVKTDLKNMHSFAEEQRANLEYLFDNLDERRNLAVASSLRALAQVTGQLPKPTAYEKAIEFLAEKRATRLATA